MNKENMINGLKEAIKAIEKFKRNEEIIVVILQDIIGDNEFRIDIHCK